MTGEAICTRVDVSVWQSRSLSEMVGDCTQLSTVMICQRRWLDGVY